MTRPLVTLALLASSMICPPQEPTSKDSPKVTLEKTATLYELVALLADKFAIQLEIDDDAENKEVKVSVRDAGCLEALDALCRAHGNVTYFYEGARDTSGNKYPLELRAAVWKEYPVLYSGHFKTILTSFMKTRQASSHGAATWVEGELCVMAPPWHNLDFAAGTRFKWEILEAQDTAGNDVRSRDGDSRFTMLSPSFSCRVSGNSESRTFAFKDFDLDKGLKLLSGKVAITVADSQVVRIPLEAAAPVELPSGTLKFESALEAEKSDFGTKWRIAFTFNPAKGDPDIDSVLENMIRYDGGRDWHFDSLRGLGSTFEVETDSLPKKPGWLEFKARSGERTIEVPFRFENVILRVK